MSTPGSCRTLRPLRGCQQCLQASTVAELDTSDHAKLKTAWQDAGHFRVLSSQGRAWQAFSVIERPPQHCRTLASCRAASMLLLSSLPPSANLRRSLHTRLTRWVAAGAVVTGQQQSWPSLAVVTQEAFSSSQQTIAQGRS